MLKPYSVNFVCQNSLQNHSNRSVWKQKKTSNISYGNTENQEFMGNGIQIYPITIRKYPNQIS